MSVPVIGWLLLVFLFRETYYKVDTQLMFQGVVHSAALEVVDNLTNANGLRALSLGETRPRVAAVAAACRTGATVPAFLWPLPPTTERGA